MEGKTTAKRKLLSTLISVVSVLLVCLYPCLFQWLNNADEAPVKDLLPMLPLFLTVAAAVWVFAFLLVRRAANAGFFTSLVMLVFINIGLISSVLKEHISWFHDRYLLLFVIVLLAVLGILLRRHKGFPGAELCLLISIALSCLTLFSFIQAAPTLYEIATAERKESCIDADTEFLSEERPNVYFVLLDEYGGPENLEKYYDFDNSDFLGSLSAAGFQVSRTSHNAESVFTWTLVPNLLNLDYVVDDLLPYLVKAEYVDDPVLLRLFRNNGYQVNLINHRDFLGDSGCNALSRPQISDSIGDHLFDNSGFGLIPYVRVGLKEKLGLSSNEYYRGELLQVTDLIEHCADYAAGEPTFTMIYLQCPHTPFVMDAEGNARYTGTSNYAEKDYYLDQLKWVNTVLERAAENIIAADPDAVILFQSDHGARFPAHVAGVDGYPELDQAAENPVMQNILNCVYNRGEPLDVEGLSGINTIRTVLNEVFGTEFDMLEEPVGYIATTTDWR